MSSRRDQPPQDRSSDEYGHTAHIIVEVCDEAAYQAHEQCREDDLRPRRQRHDGQLVPLIDDQAQDEGH